MAPAKDEESEVLDKIRSADSKCKVLIVIQNEALYESRQALAEIYGAQKKGVDHILPLSFMTAVPDKADQWPMIGPTEFKWLNMKMAVQQHFGSLGAVPQPPGTVLEQPKTLVDIVQFVQSCVLDSFDECAYITQIPKRIDDAMADELCAQTKSLLRMELGKASKGLNMSRYWPEVVIVFAPDTRAGKDDPGCGPGMYYAFSLCITFLKAGIPCLCSLMCDHIEASVACPK